MVLSDFRFVQVFIPLTADVDGKHLLNVGALLFGQVEIVCKALDLELSAGAVFGKLQIDRIHTQLNAYKIYNSDELELSRFISLSQRTGMMIESSSFIQVNQKFPIVKQQTSFVESPEFDFNGGYTLNFKNRTIHILKLKFRANISKVISAFLISKVQDQ